MSTITDQLAAVIGARKDSLIELRKRIAATLKPVPVGVTLKDEAGAELLKVQRIVTGASQWSNQTWDVTIKGTGYLADGKLVATNCDQLFHDGSNWHRRSTEGYYLASKFEYGYESAGDELKYVCGADTRTIAAKLPAAIARYMEECELETAANNATTI